MSSEKGDGLRKDGDALDVGGQQEDGEHESFYSSSWTGLGGQGKHQTASLRSLLCLANLSGLPGAVLARTLTFCLPCV